VSSRWLSPALVLLAFASSAGAEPMTLVIAGNGTVTFDVPPMTKLDEVEEAGRYRYVASSIGQDDQRFNLSVFLEPTTDCHFGKDTKEITRCFLEKSDLQPGLVKESRRTTCFETYCVVYLGIAVQVEDRLVRQLSVNLLFAYRDGWGHVHFSVLTPTDEDGPALEAFTRSLTFTE
jgi:hypothetical protein